MIVYPTIKPELIKGLETDFGSSISASIWRKIVNNHTWVQSALPIGMILFFHESITLADGTPKDPPNPDIWILCDGSTINDPESPLNGQTLPNLLNYFPKGSETIGLTGGQDTINLEHSHGGQTGITDDRGPAIADTGSDHPTGTPHVHAINVKWSNAEPIIPKFLALQPYIRYK